MDPVDAVLRARELAEERRWDEALTLLESAAREHPDDDLPHELACLHNERGLLRSDAKALGDFDAADRWVKLPLAKAGRAALLVRRDDLDGAEALVQQALGEDPELPEALLALAELRAQQNRTKEAFEAASKAAPHLGSAVALLARLLESQNRVDDARKLLLSAHDKVPWDDRYLVALARVHEEQEAIDDARRVLRQAAELNPERAEASWALCLFELRQEREGAARQALLEAVARDPEGTQAWGALERPRVPALAALLLE